MKLGRKLFTIIVLASALLICGQAGADPAAMYGMGMDSQGKGNAMTGAPSGAMAAYYNPAFLSFAGRPELQIGWMIANNNLKINGQNYDSFTTNSLEMSASVTLKGKLDFLSLGIAAYMPVYPAAKVFTSAPYAPQFILYRNLVRFAAYPGISFKVWEYLSLGIGLNILAATYGNANFTLDLGQQIVTQRDFSMDVRLALAPTGGIAFKYKDLVSAGVSYRGEIDMGINTLTMNIDVGVTTMAAGLQGVAFYTPQELNFGVGYNPIKQVRLVLDLTWAMWSLAPDQSVRMNIQENQIIPAVYSPVISPGFSDILVPRIGIEYNPWSTLNIRAGYIYYPTPVPLPVGETNLIDTDRHIATIGLGYGMDDPTGLFNDIVIDAYFQYQFLMHRDVIKANPTDPVGDYGIGGNAMTGGIGAKFHL